MWRESGTDPDNPDTDGDEMTDGWEFDNGLDPSNPADAAQDFDDDGLSNLQEQNLGTNPWSDDSDNDGFGDGQNILTVDCEGADQNSVASADSCYHDRFDLC